MLEGDDNMKFRDFEGYIIQATFQQKCARKILNKDTLIYIFHSIEKYNEIF